ncbi:MAG: zinc ribbon domain-containing protein, partial [Anaerolineae bacterium]|nr:zinc ribbon domain-containing protein [Anaerolineae bacterium]
MIRCPSCGTFNHDSQRACRSCGSALPQTRRRCPECGALNPVGNLFCDRCNTRLVETEDIAGTHHPVPTPAPDSSQDSHTAVKGISLPTRASTGDEGTGQRPELPDWLADLVDEDTEFGLTEPAQNGSAKPDTEVDAGEDAFPDWLGGGEVLTQSPLRDAMEASSLPAWLAAGTEETPREHDDASGEVAIFDESELPDWLAQAQGLTDASIGDAAESADEPEDE